MLRALQRAGAWIGYRLVRTYWWIRRPIVLGVRVLVVNQGRVLLVRHTYRDEWFLPGGSPNASESLADTALREVREETGVHLESPNLLGVYSTLSQPASDHVVVFVGHGASSASIDTGRVGGARHTSEIAAVQWAQAYRLPEKAATQTRQIVKDWRSGRSSTYRIVGG